MFKNNIIKHIFKIIETYLQLLLFFNNIGLLPKYWFRDVKTTSYL